MALGPTPVGDARRVQTTAQSPPFRPQDLTEDLAPCKSVLKKIYWVVRRNYKQYLVPPGWELHLMCLAGMIFIGRPRTGHYVGALHTMVFKPSHQSYEGDGVQEDKETRIPRSQPRSLILHPRSTAWSRVPGAIGTSSQWASKASSTKRGWLYFSPLAYFLQGHREDKWNPTRYWRRGNHKENNIKWKKRAFDIFLYWMFQKQHLKCASPEGLGLSRSHTSDVELPLRSHSFKMGWFLFQLFKHYIPLVKICPGPHTEGKMQRIFGPCLHNVISWPFPKCFHLTRPQITPHR